MCGTEAVIDGGGDGSHTLQDGAVPAIWGEWSMSVRQQVPVRARQGWA